MTPLQEEDELSDLRGIRKRPTDDQTRNAVLLQATTSILAPQPPGYLGDGGEVKGPVVDH